jgi:hypothetical protein
MQTIEFHSHEQQDEFIYNLFNGKQNGFFLDIACGNPVVGNNTYTLEKFCNWKGFCFDNGRITNWAEWRTSPFIMLNATSNDLTDFLICNIPENLVVDYVSLDVDADGTNLALMALKRVLESNIKFKAITFEHECYIHGPSIRNNAILLLQEKGFVCLFEDVRLWSGGLSDDLDSSFEDWWIHPDYFDQSILEIKEQGLYYFECVEKIKIALGNEYQVKHNCCRAWPGEYSLFWNDADKQAQEHFFRQIILRNTNESI